MALDRKRGDLDEMLREVFDSKRGEALALLPREPSFHVLLQSEKFTVLSVVLFSLLCNRDASASPYRRQVFPDPGDAVSNEVKRVYGPSKIEISVHCLPVCMCFTHGLELELFLMLH